MSSFKAARYILICTKFQLNDCRLTVFATMPESRNVESKSAGTIMHCSLSVTGLEHRQHKTCCGVFTFYIRMASVSGVGCAPAQETVGITKFERHSISWAATRPQVSPENRQNFAIRL